MALRNPLEPPVFGYPLTLSSAHDASAAAESILGHRFTNPALLHEALTHRSALHVQGTGRKGAARPERKSGGRKSGEGSNERLEFIGDRVLGLIIAEWLAERFPHEQEGELGPRHAQLVSRTMLAVIAEQAGLSRLIRVAPNEAKAGIKQLATVLADALEAVIGAIYLDSGLDAARQVVRASWTPAMTAQRLPPKDPKTALQEHVLGRGEKLPAYDVVSSEGPAHAPRFTIRVSAMGQTGQGQAGSKRDAERDAAADLLGKLT